MNSTIVIVKTDIPYEAGYSEKIANAYKDYQAWIFDEFGYEADCHSSYSMSETPAGAYFKFIFNDEEHAMAFKLRWM